MSDELRLLLERRKAILLSRDKLLNFAKYMAPDVAHRSDVRYSSYQDAKHHRAICVALEEVEAGRIPRLMIMCPPRHGKTRLASQLFPTWYVGRNPGNSLIVSSYNDTFGVDLGRGVRVIMRSPLYKQVFPDTHLRPGSASSARLQTLEGGDLFFTGTGGSLTGRGGDVLLIDDPIKNRRDADSVVMREGLWTWYTEVLRTRLMTKAGAIILICTRWHEDDLVGRLLDPSNPYYSAQEAKSWHIINFPALAEADDVLGRAEGEALWPERFDVNYLENMRRNDARGFTALYQGRPTPADGSFFKADYIRTYNRMLDVPAIESLRFYGSSDHAVATAQVNDKTCLLVAGVDYDEDIWIMPDIFWGRYPSNMAVEHMIHLMAKYKPMMWWAERGQISKSIGPFLRKRMMEKRVFCAIDEIVPIGDKLARAQSMFSRMAMRKVHFPAFAPWYADARDQLLKFPQGGRDDFVDALSLIGLGLAKQIPHRQIKKIDEGPREMTLGWIKKLTKDRERAERNLDGGF